MKPLVSCICPTYNRAPQYIHLLQECVYWFTRQDYDNAELLIVNDNASVTLHCAAPRVRVLNLRERFKNIGSKYAAMIELARGDIVLPWEDDDIALPWRISQSVERLGQSLYWNPRGSWYEDRGRLHYKHAQGYCFNASAIRREAFDIVPMPDTNKHDATWDTQFRLLHESLISPAVCTHPREWSYVYRWGVGIHLSGFTNMDKAYIEADKPKGDYTIEPTMKRDYAGDICELVQLL